MSIQKDIAELINAKVITAETALHIEEYYRKRRTSGDNPLLAIFGILAAILTGLGIILIIAHNWDDLSRFSKTIIAFLPLIIAQMLCVYVLWRRAASTAWREGTSAFLFLTVGASISLISQIYHIAGDLSAFLLTWALLCLPIFYLMRSSIASLLYIIIITWYAAASGYRTYPQTESYYYWFLLLLGLPFYYSLLKNKANSNYTYFHHWFIPLSILTALGTLSISTEEWILPAYVSLLAVFYLIGSTEHFESKKLRNNAFKIISSLGTMAILLVLSFDWFWERQRRNNFSEVALVSPEFIATAVLSLLAGLLFYRHFNRLGFSGMKPLSAVFIVFIPAFIVGYNSQIAVVLINLYVLIIGFLTIREGARLDHLGILNYGLLIITALVICRFFDTDLSFVLRGVLFIVVGAAFFVANQRIIKRRKVNE